MIYEYACVCVCVVGGNYWQRKLVCSNSLPWNQARDCWVIPPSVVHCQATRRFVWVFVFKRCLMLMKRNFSICIDFKLQLIDQANRNFVSNLNSKIRVNKSNFALNFHPFFCVIAFPSIYRAHGDQSTYQLTNFCMTLTPTPLIIHISILMTDNICSFRSIHKANCFVVPFVDKLGRHTGCMGCRTDKVTY